jgi:3-phosphoglycerate kinase
VVVGDCLAGPHHLASMTLLPRSIRERALGLAMERELLFANRLRHEWGSGFVLVVRGGFAPYRQLLNFAVTHPGLTVVALGPLGRMLADRPASDLEVESRSNDPDPAEAAEARSWAQKARSRSVSVELGQGAEAIDRIEATLGRSKATLLIGVSPVDAATNAVVSAAPRGNGVLVSVAGAREDVLTLLDHPGPSKSCFASNAGQSFLGLLCGQKLSGVEALRRVG